MSLEVFPHVSKAETDTCQLTVGASLNSAICRGWAPHRSPRGRPKGCREQDQKERAGGAGARLSARVWPLMVLPALDQEVERWLLMVRPRLELPARRFTRSFALGRSSGSLCRQSRTSCFSSCEQSPGTLRPRPGKQLSRV